jgi:hypothetical protein
VTLKNDLVFGWGDFRWTETYYDLSSTVAGDQTSIDRARKLAAARAGFLGGGAFILFVRQTESLYPPTPPANRRNTFLVYQTPSSTVPWYGPDEYQQNVGPLNAYTADAPFYSVKARFELLPKKFTTKFFGAFPDSSLTGPDNVDLTHSATALQGFNNFVKFIVTGQTWGVRIRNFDAGVIGLPIPMILLGQPLANSDVWQATLGDPITIDANTYYLQTRKSVGTSPFSQVNRVWKIGSTSTPTVVNLLPAMRAPKGWLYNPGSGTLQKVAYTTGTIQNIRLGATTHRPRGVRGGGAGRGRKGSK